MALRARNALLMAKIETTSGTFVTLAASTDAIRVRNVSVSPQTNNQANDSLTSSLDALPDLIGGMSMDVNFEFFIKGSGVAGTSPEWGKIMRACGWAETLTATAVPAAPEAVTAGSVTSATLGTTAVGTAHLYRGMPIAITGTPAGANGIGLITDYTAGKLATLADTRSVAIAATNSYQILPNVRYSPASINIPSLSLEFNIDGVRYQFSGARGNLSMTWSAGAGANMQVQMKAMYVGSSDSAMPSAVFDASNPGSWRNSNFWVNRLPVALSSLSFNMNNQLVLADNPNSAEGFDPAEIVSRKFGGSMDPQLVLRATRDLMTDFRNRTARPIGATLLGGAGATAGNRVGFVMPSAVFTGNRPGDSNGIATEQIDYQTDGQDSGAFLTLY
jgi:hypothetical protein